MLDAGSQHNGSTHYSHGSLPHYNVHQQYEPVRSTTPQFSTFLPRATREASPLPASAKLPHPQGEWIMFLNNVSDDLNNKLKDI